MSRRLDWVTSPSHGLHGEIVVPGDKSVSHRAIMLSALAEGTSRITGFLEGEDTLATARIFTRMGVRIDAPSAGERIVHGVGLRGLRTPEGVLDCGNSGTAMRLLCGVLAGQGFDSTLAGDASLSKRPMRRVTEPLARMGAAIDTAAGGTPPLRVRGSQHLHGTDYTSPIASAQVKSSVLLAGLYAEGETVVHEPRPTRDYTERMLTAFGWPVAFEPGRARLSGGHTLCAVDVEVPADFSSAAFFIVAATLVPGSRLVLRNVGMNPRRTGLLHVLRAMGADIVEENVRDAGGERVADLVVRHARLRGIKVPVEHVADMIDEFPVLFVAAACADGATTIRGAEELRVKESDRIAVMAAGLRALGVGVDETPDGAVIEGGRLHGGVVDSHGDHRCAMAFAVAGAVAAAETRIADCANVATSFPTFVQLGRACGLAAGLVAE
ncbi:MAG: 3-phosphoshikimate 1-carboxyvinyltransferase [Rhodanobacteraceae bacterium]|nr:MAG: 3-phosphoshikimate 1-carboxyvinyltransferase [Rhodanobacteraceae bacterium]